MIQRTATALLFTFVLSIAPARGAADQPPPPLPQIPRDKTFKITDYGAVADGKTMCTDAITKAIDACKSAGGGKVIIPAGKFLTGPFDLVSKMDLHLDDGATLLFTDDFDAYPITNNRRRHGITAAKLTDVAITGKGTIDGQGEKWWVEFRKIKGKPDEKQHPRRPNLIDLGKCQRLLVQDVTIVNSPNFHLVPGDCEDVTIDGITITAPADAPNTDAIDPSGHNYLITKCTLDVGDDNIAVKPSHAPESGDRLSCEDFLVTNCTFKHGHGMSIGGQTPGGMRRMTVRDCTFDGTDAGIRMKAPRGQGGLVEDLTYENITMKNVKVPIFITSYYPNNTTPKEPDKDPPQEVNKTTPIWRNIRISNLSVSDCSEGGRIFGLPEMPVQDVVFRNVKISAEKPLVIANAKGVRFEDSQVTAKKPPAVILRNAKVTGLPPEATAAR